MTNAELIETFVKLHPTNNPQCDGINCKHNNSTVRTIPLDDSCSVNLCSDCYDVEIGISIDAELDGKMPYLPTTVPFDVYPIHWRK